MNPLISSFDPDVPVLGRSHNLDERIEAGAFAAYSAFIKDPLNAARRWDRVPERTKQQWRDEAAAVLRAAA